MPANSSVRSIIGQFSVAVNARKRAFSGVHRSVNTRKMSYLSFPSDQHRVHRALSNENLRFPTTENSGKRSKTLVFQRLPIC